MFLPLLCLYLNFPLPKHFTIFHYGMHCFFFFFIFPVKFRRCPVMQITKFEELREDYKRYPMAPLRYTHKTGSVKMVAIKKKGEWQNLASLQFPFILVFVFLKIISTLFSQSWTSSKISVFFCYICWISEICISGSCYFSAITYWLVWHNAQEVL